MDKKELKNLGMAFNTKKPLNKKLNEIVKTNEAGEEINFSQEIIKEINNPDGKDIHLLSSAKRNKIKRIVFIDPDLDERITAIEKIIKKRTNYRGGLRSSLMNILVRDAIESMENEEINSNEAKNILKLQEDNNG